MLDEIAKALAPWPLLQYSFTVFLVIGGVYAIMKGLNKSKEEPKHQESIEQLKTEWEAYNQLKNIEENSFRQVVLLEKLIEAVNRLTDNIWNRKQF